MNILSMKALSWRQDKLGFFSPQRGAFQWPKGVVASECRRGICGMHKYNSDCTCGLYSSPNPKALDEYAKYPSTVFVLLNLYGWLDCWTGPKDLPHTYVARSWGAQIVGIVGTMTDGSPLKLEPHRYQSALLGFEHYGVKMYPWEVAKDMIQMTWVDQLGFSPYFEAIPAPSIFFAQNKGDTTNV